MAAIKLVSIIDYATHWNISRPTVYRLIDNNKLTRYENPEGDPLLNIDERPKGVKSYPGFRLRRTKR